MKRNHTRFIERLNAFFSRIAGWFSSLFAVNDNSAYSRFIRRVFGGCFALLTLILVASLCSRTFQDISRMFEYDEYLMSYTHRSMILSRGATYHIDCDEKTGYIENSAGEKTISDISWIATPSGNDSLVCYSDGCKRGYFNIHTGMPSIKPQYAHAWIFSEGLAAVDDKGWIKFIDGNGKVVLDPKIPYIEGSDGYIFHNNHCATHNDDLNKIGLIDKKGRWILPPKYASIVPRDSFWIVNNGKEQSVISDNMQTIIPFIAKRIRLENNIFKVTMHDHTLRQYDLEGKLIDDFYISDIEYLTYDTPELKYPSVSDYGKDEEKDDANLATEPQHVKETARCRQYEAEYGWYGLMSPEGKILTPPSYISITAIDKDLYLCEENSGNGVLLNGKGEKVE